MTERSHRKLFLGARLRRLRRELGVTQARMASDLTVSPSYLNLLERNQRPVTAQVLLKLADAYELDLRSFSGEAEAGGAQTLTEVFADPLFKELGLQRQEIVELADASPAIAEAVTRLYQAYVDRRRTADLAGLDPAGALGAGAALTPTDWVREHVQGQRNVFAEIDERAEALAAELGGEPHDFPAAARQRLLTRFGVKVQITPIEVLGDLTRRYDHHRKRLFMSELLSASSRAFGLAYQLALLEGAEVIAACIERSAPPDRPTRNLLKVSLTNTFAAALLMPYEDFHDAAELCAYDIDRLKARFGVSYEQASQRLTTLSKPGRRGVPLFMIRVDSAGNVSKRYAAGAFPFSRFGGSCPRWNLHACFRTPGRSLTQVIETLDGARYFTVSRTVERAASGYACEDREVAIGLGCELKFASKLVYSRGLDLDAPVVTPIGPACRICERRACPQRAAEPVSRTLMVDDFSKSVSPYPFAPG